jgi:hypothetical protein
MLSVDYCRPNVSTRKKYGMIIRIGNWRYGNWEERITIYKIGRDYNILKKKTTRLNEMARKQDSFDTYIYKEKYITLSE